MKNREYYIDKAKKRMNRTRADARTYVFDYLTEHSCIDCGEARIPCLVFDHVNDDKIDSVSRMVSLGTPLDTIAAEIEKCEVRCANCHMIRHAVERGTWIPD